MAFPPIRPRLGIKYPNCRFTLLTNFSDFFICYNSNTTQPGVKIFPAIDFLGSNYPTIKFSSRNSKFSVFDEYPSVPHRPPQFNTLVPHKDHTFSAPKILQFHTKNPSVQHQNPLSSTPKTPRFHTENPSVPHQKRVTHKKTSKNTKT